MKISHSARPRNRSIRNSRSPAGSETADIETTAGAGLAAAPATSAGGGAATRSAVDTISPRVEKIGLRVQTRPGIIQAPALHANFGGFDFRAARRGRVNHRH